MALESSPFNLVPAGWTQERQKLSKQARTREWLAVAGAIYLVFLLAAAGYIIWLQHQVSSIDAQVAEATPTVDTIAQQESPVDRPPAAVDPTRYSVELMYQIYKSIPSDDLKVTIFDQTPVQFMIEGEAPTAAWPSSTWTL